MNIKSNIIFKVLVALIVLFLSFELTHKFGYRIIKVNGNSMFPTIKNNDILIVNCWYHRLYGLHHGDVVMFKDKDGFLVIKRIISLPGDIVELNTNIFKIKNGEYFVMGDCREKSFDSRNYGPIKQSSIIGIVKD